MAKQIKLTGAIIVEETVKPGSVNKDISGIHNPQSPSILTIPGHGIASALERRVIPPRHYAKWNRRLGVRLIIRRLGLDLSHKHIRCTDKLVLIECVMFTGGTPEPEISLGRFRVEAATSIDGEATELRVFDVVIGNPEPDIFHVEALRGFGEVERHECCEAVAIYLIGGCDWGVDEAGGGTIG